MQDHITGLLADPALIRAEISKRLEQARTSDPVTRQRKQLELALAKAGTSITAMVEAYSEQLITIDELRTRMPDLRAREASLRSQLDDIPGIGATRRQRLLKHFGSVRAVRQASVDDLAKAPGMNKKAAEAVATYFAQLDQGGGDQAIDAEITEAIADESS